MSLQMIQRGQLESDVQFRLFYQQKVNKEIEEGDRLRGLCDEVQAEVSREQEVLAAEEERL